MQSQKLLVIFLALICPPLSFGGEKTVVQRLTRDGGFKQHLQWSPDGKRFLLTRIHQGKMGLWTMTADGADLKPLLSPEANIALEIENGETAVVFHADDGAYGYVVMPLSRDR